MNIIHHLDDVQPAADVILTIGTFDGVHLGHQHLLAQLVRRAHETQLLSAVLTFHPHPRTVLQPDRRPAYLSTPEERAIVFEALGIDLLVLLHFTPTLAQTPAETLVGDLYHKLRMRELWVGPDFAMGRQREGDAVKLQTLANHLGYHLRIIAPLTNGNVIVSSTRIRTLVQEGQVDEAARLLGRYYAISGRVGPGAQRGRRLGFRTANLPVDPNRATPANGVYAAWAEYGSQRYRCVVNVGTRPSFGENEPNIEAHLLDFEGDLYGKPLTIEFVQRLRPELRFSNAADLVAQINRDIAAARELLTDETKAKPQ